MEIRTLKRGEAYYFCIPHWARKAGCPVKNEPLGRDYFKAVGRAGELNIRLDVWREAWRASRRSGGSEATNRPSMLALSNPPFWTFWCGAH
jgi:hypothetical protein